MIMAFNDPVVVVDPPVTEEPVEGDDNEVVE